MAYSDQELHSAATQLAQALNLLNGRLDRLEAKPGVDRITQDIANGRRHARSMGYSQQEIEQQLEPWMQSNGVANYEIAVRERPNPSGKINILSRVEQDELDLLMSGDEDTFLNIATQRALDEVRGG
jgi:hypothetical protein